MRILLCLVIALLAACGQKGQLYLPDAATQEVSETEQETDRAASKDEDKTDNGGTRR